MSSTLRRTTRRARRFGKALVGRHLAARRQRPERLRQVADDYEVGPLILDDGKVPVRWFVKADNFGDLLSPWLIGKMTGRDVVFAEVAKPHYVAVGSILNRANPRSVVWGTGSFG